jgi:hypothetical protein
MNRSGSVGKPLVIESDATLANGTEAPVQGTTAETLAGDVNVTLTPLQRMVEEILEPLSGQHTLSGQHNFPADTAAPPANQTVPSGSEITPRSASEFV